MVAEAMTETTLGEDTRGGIVVSQVGRECAGAEGALAVGGGVCDGPGKAERLSRRFLARCGVTIDESAK